MLARTSDFHTKPVASSLSQRDRLKHYHSRTIPVTHNLYMPAGSFAISTTSPQFAEMFMALNDANAAIVAYSDAVSSKDSEKWSVASQRFAALADFAFAVNDADDSKANLNLATICDSRVLLENACAAASMYYTPSNHTNVDMLHKMDELNSAAGEFALLDGIKIRGRQAVVECETNLNAADEAMPSVSNSDDPEVQSQAIEEYKVRAATAVVLAKMVPDEAKTELFDNVKKRVAAADETLRQYYADDYNRLIRDAETMCARK